MMKNGGARAIARQESTIEQGYRAIFMKEGECRFKLEVIFSSDRTTKEYDLHSVSKPSAEKEANDLVHLLVQSFDEERFIWRVSGDTTWSIASKEIENNGPSKVKKESLWNRIIDAFFLTEDELN